MKLFPQHLRDRQHGEIIKRRSYGVTGKTVPTGYEAIENVPEPQLGTLGRFWTKGSGLTEKQAATGLPSASMATLGTLWLPPSMGAFIGFFAGIIMTVKKDLPPEIVIPAITTGVAALAALSAGPWAQMAFRGLYKKSLTEAEIEALLNREMDSLERAYLQLVRDAIRQQVPEEAEADLQSAIQALGEAIDRLPAIMVTPLDTNALRKEADTLYADAQNQPDRMISESVERRAEALHRRAEANDRSALFVRRTAALRAEIEAQIEALREGLGAFHSGITVGADMALL